MNKGDVMKNELKTEIVGEFPCRDEQAKTKKVINDYRKEHNHTRKLWN